MLIRDRSKMFRESISKLDRYREALNSKKRQRTDLSSSDRGVGVNMSKMGNQIYKSPNDGLTQRLEGKTSNSMLNKRIRTSVADGRVFFTQLLPWFYSLSVLSTMLYINCFIAKFSPVFC